MQRLLTIRINIPNEKWFTFKIVTPNYVKSGKAFSINTTHFLKHVQSSLLVSPVDLCCVKLCVHYKWIFLLHGMKNYCNISAALCCCGVDVAQSKFPGPIFRGSYAVIKGGRSYAKKHPCSAFPSAVNWKGEKPREEWSWKCVFNVCLSKKIIMKRSYCGMYPF